MRSGAIFEAPAFIPSFNNVAMVGETIEKCGCHLGVAEDDRPFAKGQIGGDDDRGALIELAHEMEEQLHASLSERQIAKLIENGEVLTGEIISDSSLPPCTCFGLQAIDEIDGIEETATQTGADTASRDGNGEMRLTRSGATDENDVALAGDEATARKIAHQGFVDGRAVEVKIINVLCQRELGDGHLIFDRARLLFGAAVGAERITIGETIPRHRGQP